MAEGKTTEDRVLFALMVGPWIGFITCGAISFLHEVLLSLAALIRPGPSYATAWEPPMWLMILFGSGWVIAFAYVALIESARWIIRVVSRGKSKAQR